MKLTFNIDYRTNWGESVYLTSSLEEMGSGNYEKAVKMRLIGEGTWQVVVELPDNTPDFVYHYIVRHENGYVKKGFRTLREAIRNKGNLGLTVLYEKY